MAYCAYRQAEACARAGIDRASAEAPLGLAHKIASTLGASRLRADVEVLARRLRLSLGRSASVPAATDERELTQREREVLELLAEGRTNREIGHALFISPKTVSVHVSNIFGKLGVERRVEAVRVGQQLGLLTR